jgi:hypothetical protein
MQIANVEYFWKKCNKVLKTSYTGNSKQAINIEWLVAATRKVYADIHQPKNGCRLLLSSTFSNNTNKQAVNVTLVNKVVNYLANLNKPCDTDCDCPCGSSNCNTNCGNCSHCCNECDCDCGNPIECACDCAVYWNCNCTNIPNYCDSQCDCACNCCDDCYIDHNDTCNHTDYSDSGSYSERD